ncbi:MAG: arylsulfatase B [Candidatus Latescibacterota bacterium]
MQRRQFLNISTLGLAALGSGAFSCSREKAEGAGDRPNFVLIVADDCGWNDVGWHGSEIRTPNLDRLAREGAELDRFYVYPVCSPTRAALLTGRPPSRFGILGPIAGRSELALPAETVTLPELLRRSGYFTAICGKWHLGLRPEVGPNKYGFEHSYGYLHGQVDPYTHIYKNGDKTWHRNGEFIEEKGHATDLITREATRFITDYRNPKKPFFLSVTYSVPHYPLDEEEKWVEPYASLSNESRRLFAASMTHLDDAAGGIITALQEAGLMDNTFVIFMSDNGGQESWTPADEYGGKFFANDRLGDNTPLRGWKGDLYEGAIRVPAFVYAPGRMKPGKISGPIHVCDLLPTLAGYAGAEVTSDMNVEGMDVRPALEGGSLPADRVMYWRSDTQFAVRKGDWKLIRTVRGNNALSDELFQVSEDPYETRDLAEEQPEIMTELRNILEEQTQRERNVFS